MRGLNSSNTIKAPFVLPRAALMKAQVYSEPTLIKLYLQGNTHESRRGYIRHHRGHSQ